VLDGLLDLSNDDFLGRDALGHDALDLHAREGEQIVDFLNRLAVEIKVGREPVE
jgi:hypothetical protein